MGMISGGMTADIWDYQQYKSGERLDGCSGIFGLVLSPLTMLMGALIPFVYSRLGFTTDWDILFVDSIRNNIIGVTILISVISSVLSTIPFFFYDLTDEKHKMIVEELKRRAEQRGLQESTAK